jgi:predicted P-loop ATPase
MNTDGDDDFGHYDYATRARELAETFTEAPEADEVPPDWPDVNKQGFPLRTYRNAREAITALGVVCSFDQFHDRMIVGGHPIDGWAGELSDAVSVILRQAIIDRFGFDPGKDHLSDAATELCLEGRFNPILDYLDGLAWDGVARLDQWLTTYLGAEDTPLNHAIGRLTLIAAVRRVRQPGCKFDFIPTLEGAEGTMKSTSIVTLAGVENFSDQTILTQSDKEQQELVRGVWIYEIADLAGMRRADVEKIKAFASRTHDRARPAYGRRRVDAPRHCIFIATTNEDEYLQSQTGNRRFWPVKTGTIDIEALRRDRDQLWAEAAIAETEGEPLVLPKDQWGNASAAQDERRIHDPWDDLLSGVPGRICLNEAGIDEERLSSEDLLKVLEVPPGKAMNTDVLRLKRVMRRLGWSGPKKFRFGGATKRGYFREVSETAGTDGTGGTVEHDF